ncbi:MAG: NADPH-dependent F420 reductase, partial [Alphaproteobacteria bacterium]|nr:NADPH-dependent F420 reductase [Alphaproteobacteria bacterium]
ALLAASAAGVLAAASSPHSATAQAGAGTLRIGTIGSGHIGGTIGALWIKAGHEVMFSSRHPEELKDMVQQLGPRAKAGTVADAVAFAQVVFIAVPYGAIPQIGEQYGSTFDHKILMDACNAVPARDGTVTDEVEKNGIGVTTQKYFPSARVVRAFNTLGYTIFEKEAHRSPPLLAIPIAGDDPEAVRTAEDLVRDAGFEPVLVGKLADARRFQRGQPGYGQNVTAPELKQKLSLP